MGFRYKRFDYVGGVGAWDSSSTPRTRSEVVLKDMADWLTSNGTGWALNTSRNATTSDFVEVPFWNQVTQVSYPSTYNAPSLFFVNSISRCKLFMCVQGNVEGSGLFRPETNIDDGYFSTYSLYSESQQGESAFGIIMCIIPGGSSNDFGSTFDKTSNFIPSDGTPILGTCEGWGYASTYYPISYIYSNTAGYCFSYTLFATPYVLGINGGFTSNGSNADTATQKGYFIGRIIGTTAHDSLRPDNRYGVVQFGTCSSSTNTEFSNACTQNRSLGSNTATIISQTVSFSSNLERNRSNSSGCFFLQNGDRLLYTYQVASIRWYPESIDTMSELTQSSALSNAIRWVPYSIGVSSTNLSTYGVVAGDGFKGYLDTDLFRCSLCTPNQLYNSGSFIGCANNLMLGWDQNNTDYL